MAIDTIFHVRRLSRIAGLFLGASLVFSLPSLASSSMPSPTIKAAGDDLTSKLIQHHLYIHQPEVYKQALTVLEDVQKLPPCHQLAAQSLIDSCQSLLPSSTVELEMNHVREEYATRLAVCELMTAKGSLPSQCRLFAPSKKNCGKTKPSFPFFGESRRNDPEHDAFITTPPDSLCYTDASAVQVTRCISALQSSPQSWTSYSNAQQNVMVVCQASRSAMEKGKFVARNLFTMVQVLEFLCIDAFVLDLHP